MNLVTTLRVALIAGAALLVELLCRLNVITPFTMTSPSNTFVNLVHLLASGKPWPDLLFTLGNTLAAIVTSIVAGFAIGVIVQRIPRLRRVVSPLLAAYYAVPTFVFYPLMIVLLGLNRLSLIAIGVTLGLIGMIVNTIDGMDRIPRVFLKTAATYRMDPLSRTLLVALPAATPHLITGIKLAVTYSITGVIAGEFILSVAGIGRGIAVAYNDLDNKTMYALLALLLTTVTIVNVGIHEWERRVYERWGLR
jgi:NitT/TauT family transport system permease protein